VFTNGHLPDIAPALLASVELPDGRRAKTVFSLISERYLDERYAPETVAAECGIDAATITRIAHEIAHVAFNEAVELPIRFKAPGDHVMPCQEFCGIGHQGMWGKVKVVDKAAFAKLAAARRRLTCVD